MAQYLDQRYEAWVGRTVKDRSGHRIGKVEDIYTNDDTGQPEWLAVSTGRFGPNLTFVPVAGATEGGDDDLRVPFPREQVKEAPRGGSDGRLSREEVTGLFAHYGFDRHQEPARPRRPVRSERISLSASFDEEPGDHGDDPLDWNHDERIDSIRPRADQGLPLQR